MLWVRLVVAAVLALTVAGCPAPPSPGHDGGLGPCVERPGVATAPGGQLPCELLPPGFKP